LALRQSSGFGPDPGRDQPSDFGLPRCDQQQKLRALKLIIHRVYQLNVIECWHQPTTIGDAQHGHDD
jgi:hypothetical protein